MSKKKYNFSYPRDNKKYEIDNIKEVKKVIDNYYNNKFYSKKEYDHERFMYYHLCRNHFNQYMNSKTGSVTTLTRTFGSVYKDNLGKQWTEVSTMKNYFHMPKDNYKKAIVGLEEAWSRKFLRDDTITGLGGEFEMIIRKDGKRVDAITHHIRQETYNFGRTSNFLAHKKLDVDPHGWDDNYLVKTPMGKVKIEDNTTLPERVKNRWNHHFD